ncbi:MAG TPA: hypothetical protein VF885_12550 [Arthrobacter sp.]
MTDANPNRHLSGAKGGQFAEKIQSEAANVRLETPEGEAAWVDEDGGLTIEGGNFDTPEDQLRYQEAAAFLEESGIEGKVSPLFTQYRPDEGLDAVILQTDGRNMILRHAGTMSPQVEYGDDEDDAWTFRMEAGDGAGKTEHEVLADVVASARHDAACQEAWRGHEDTFQYGDEANVRDFGVRYDSAGTRIITVDIDNAGRQWELVQKGDDDVKVFISGSEVPLPHIQLDALAHEFDEDHEDGMGDILWKGMMRDAADRAAKESGYNPRGINRP